MKLIKYGLLLLAFAGGPAAIAPAVRAANDPAVVKLAPYEVSDTSLELGFHLRIASSKKTGAVKSVQFSAIERGSLADKAGLRAGDRLIAVDGHEVAGITRSELDRLCTVVVKWGEARTFVFTIERGLFRRRQSASLTVRMKPKAE